MKLYNKTKCPDEILEPLLSLAGRSVGARTSKVVVRVTQGHREYVSGLAMKCKAVRRGFLDGGSGKSWIATDGGYIKKLTLPKFPQFLKNASPQYLQKHLEYFKIYCEPGVLAKRFFEVSQHEWSHIRDYQNDRGQLEWSQRLPLSRRRINHKDRPEEWRADQYVSDAKQYPSQTEIVQKLADWLKNESLGLIMSNEK